MLLTSEVKHTKTFENYCITVCHQNKYSSSITTAAAAPTSITVISWFG